MYLADHTEDPHAPDHATAPEWKQDLFALLEQPTSSPGAFLVHIVVTGLIVVSAAVTVIETIPAVHAISTNVWFGLETTLVLLFTAEYITRCVAWSATWRSLFAYTSSFFGIVDLLAVLPYYIELLLHEDTSTLFRFSILRMFRLLRVFRPFRHTHSILLTIEVMYLSVRRSQHALLAISFFVIMILTVFSTLLYFAERGTWDPALGTFINTDGDPSQFASIPAAAWFVLQTITTVGYGEITPRSFLGRFVTLPLLLFGLFLIALPSFVLGREFSIVWEKMEPQMQDDWEPESPQALRRTDNFLGRRREADLIFDANPGNRKDLNERIEALTKTVDQQGRMLERLLEIMDKGKNRERETS
ncbi:voltage-gated potassium channel [Cylindrobasidium torrendii FP15055 ss-10]|uniref:Voltage-gated potassium channel n=1 Tax=Cylindrobasidium torrendii FP15055 ss-10 TaxID=1314674 RepID=A0A0D7BTJ1_9AGAR|nr:voltage-gated potassium channel [Cylindrobasidium torrendii FP15055 ss-10]